MNEDALGLLAEEVERLLENGLTPDVEALAARFGVDVEDARRCVESLRVLDDALLADLETEEDLPPPALPEDYEILDELGRGGMGVVYRARQKSLDRIVAVKVVRPAALGFGSAVARFRREARSLARLRHPGIVSVHEVGTAGDAVFFTMDLVEGESLADRLRDGPLEPSEAVRVVAQVAGAVAHAHGRGIIHRDLKPANVLLDRDGNAWVVDFGVAHEQGMSLDATGTGGILGTPTYMAPEQARGGKVGEAADVYALGAILYECLAGRPPFVRSTLADLVHAVIHEDPPAIRKAADGVPTQLAMILRQAMARRPDQRYATAMALMSDLRSFAEGGRVDARPPGLAYRLGAFVRRRRAMLFAVGLTTVLVVAAVLAWALPRLGRTPETLTETAEMLLDEGECGAARALLEEAVRDHGAEQSDTVGLRIHRALARARAGVVRRLLLAGSLDEAEALSVKTLDEAVGMLGEKSDWAGLEDLLWDRARIAGARGNLEEEAERWQEMRQRLGQASPTRYSTARGFEHGRRPFPRLLEQAENSLEDGFPARGSLLRFLIHACGRGRNHEARAFVAGRSGPEARGLLTDLVQLEARSTAENRAYWRSWLLAPLMNKLLHTSNRDSVEELLSEFASDEDQEVKRLGHELLALMADIPDRESALAVWRATRESPASDWLRARIDLAVRTENGRWLRSHLGHRKRPDGGWKAWWSERAEGDPRAWFTMAVARVPEDIALLRTRLRRAPVHGKSPWHFRLLLAQPGDIRAPIHVPDTRGIGVTAGHLPAAWSGAFDAGSIDEPWLARIAWIRCEDALPARILWRDARPIRLGESLVFEGVDEETPPGLHFRLRIPGLETPRRPAPPIRTKFAATLTLAIGEHGLVLEGVDGGLRREGFGGSTGVLGNPFGLPTGPGRAARAGFVNAFDGLGGFSSLGDGRTMNDFPLAVVVPPDSGPSPWTLDDWREQLATDLRELIEERARDRATPNADLSEFMVRHQDCLQTHPRIIEKLGVPGAGPLLRELYAKRGAWLFSHGERLTPACLLASGDAGPLDGLSPDGQLAISHRIAPDEARWERWWARLLLTTDEPRIRAFAAKQLESSDLEGPIAISIERAIEEDGLEVSDTLRSRVRGARARNLSEMARGAWFHLLAGAISVLIGLIALTRLVIGHTRPGRRLRCGAWLALSGFLLLGIDIRLGSVQLLPDEIGLSLALIGVLVLSPFTGRLGSRCVFIGLGVALISVAAHRVVPLAGFLLTAGAGIALAVMSLPRMTSELHGHGHRASGWFLVFYSIPAVSLWTLTIVAIVRGDEALLSLSGDWLGIVYLIIAATVIHALVALRARAGQRAALEGG